MALIPADSATAFWFWAKCLGELVFWAKSPLPERTTRPEWLDAYRADLQDKGDRARDAATDDATRNQVVRSRSLALGLARLLNECSELNNTPCRSWPAIERQPVEELQELRRLFAQLVDGEQSIEVAGDEEIKPTSSGWPAVTPDELRKLFSIEQDAMLKRLKKQDIANERITSKSYRVDPNSLPDGWEHTLKRG